MLAVASHAPASSVMASVRPLMRAIPRSRIAIGTIAIADATRDTTSGHSPEWCPARARNTK